MIHLRSYFTRCPIRILSCQPVVLPFTDLQQAQLESCVVINPTPPKIKSKSPFSRDPFERQESTLDFNHHFSGAMWIFPKIVVPQNEW